MGKFLKSLLIIMLPLSGAVLVLACLLFVKRELLKGRTQKLENAIVKLAATLEGGPASVESKPQYPKMDKSPATRETLENPEYEDIWSSYKPELEIVQDKNLVDLDAPSKREQLATYARKDPVSGLRLLDGEGTMQGLLSDVVAKAGDQYNRLNETRHQLTSVREQLVSCVQELNDTKGSLRKRLKEIDELTAQCAKLESMVKELTQRVAEMEEKNRQLEDTVAEQKTEIAGLTEESRKDKAEIDRLKKIVNVGTETLGVGRGQGVAQIEPGTKGKVIAVNEEWQFVVLDLTDSFLSEMLGENLTGQLPANVELNLRAAADPTQFVGKVQLIRIRPRQKVGIADILPAWKQTKIQAGDVLFF